MTDPEPDMGTDKMRQANGRRMNLRVLMVALVAIIIGFGLVVWYNSSVSPDTSISPQPGETAGEAGSAEDLEELPTPVPVEPTQ